MVRDLRIGDRYTYKGEEMGILCGKFIQGAGGAGHQEPYYKITFQQKNSKVELTLDWDEKFTPVHRGHCQVEEEVETKEERDE